MPLRALQRVAILAIVVMAGPATAAYGGFAGVWNDNASEGLKIGRLDVAATSVQIGRKVAYRTKAIQDDGAGSVLKVTGSDRRRDPFGCGPTERVTYLVLEPLASTPGTSQQAIRLIFYGGGHVPDVRTLDADPAVCAVHPYGRAPVGASSSPAR